MDATPLGKEKLLLLVGNYPRDFGAISPSASLAFGRWDTVFGCIQKKFLGGIKKVLNAVGIIDLKISKSDFMRMEFEELKSITKKQKQTEMGVLQWSQFLMRVLISQLLFLFPLVVLVIGILWIKK